MPENKQIILVSINNKYEFGNYPVIQFIQNGQKKYLIIQIHIFLMS